MVLFESGDGEGGDITAASGDLWFWVTASAVWAGVAVLLVALLWCLYVRYQRHLQRLRGETLAERRRSREAAARVFRATEYLEQAAAAGSGEAVVRAVGEIRRTLQELMTDPEGEAGGPAVALAPLDAERRLETSVPQSGALEGRPEPQPAKFARREDEDGWTAERRPAPRRERPAPEPLGNGKPTGAETADVRPYVDLPGPVPARSAPQPDTGDESPTGPGAPLTLTRSAGRMSERRSPGVRVCYNFTNGWDRISWTGEWEPDSEERVIRATASILDDLLTPTRRQLVLDLSGISRITDDVLVALGEAYLYALRNGQEMRLVVGTRARRDALLQCVDRDAGVPPPEIFSRLEEATGIAT